MQINLYYRILIHDEKGKLISRTRWKKSKSFVLQFLQHIDALMNHAWKTSGTGLTIKNTAGADKSVVVLGTLGFLSSEILSVFAADNNDNYGIVVGTGITTPANNDYALATKIAHGTSSGQLDYGAHSRTATAIVGLNVDFVISRTFYNGSGGSITVNEIGIICATTDYATTIQYFLIARDIIDAKTVDNTKTLTVQYTAETTV